MSNKYITFMKYMRRMIKRDEFIEEYCEIE